MKIRIGIYFFLLFNSFSLAQNENSKWYFGNYAGLDFMTSPPTILSNSASNGISGCSSVADALGNLLFYTDGKTVYNQVHSIMANGNNLGTVTNTINLDYQCSLIVKQPGMQIFILYSLIAWIVMNYVALNLNLIKTYKLRTS